MNTLHVPLKFLQRNDNAKMLLSLGASLKPVKKAEVMIRLPKGLNFVYPINITTFGQVVGIVDKDDEVICLLKDDQVWKKSGEEWLALDPSPTESYAVSRMERIRTEELVSRMRHEERKILNNPNVRREKVLHAA
jgi:hypothetical protein